MMTLLRREAKHEEQSVRVLLIMSLEISMTMVAFILKRLGHYICRD